MLTDLEYSVTKEGYMKGRWTISDSGIRILLSKSRRLNDLQLIEKCLDQLKVPKTDLDINERLTYYDLFMELK